ncbi:MAG: HNH endonuclease signature motif containing protein [Alcanivorax sp.]
MRRKWSEAEDRVLVRNYPDSLTADIARRLGRTNSSVYQRAQLLGLKKSEAFLSSEAAGRTNLLEAGKKHRFHADQTPWNAGKKGWQAGGRAKETQFKKGRRPHTWNPVGHERLTKDGYLQRKVADTGCTPRDYRMVHHLVWEEAGGEIPPGHVLVFRNGNKRDIRPENLELITRAENARRNSIHRYPPELRAAMRAAGKLRRKIQEAES